MTPLARQIVKELTLPLKRRSFADGCGLLAKMSDIHCFEVSEVYEVARDLIIGPAVKVTDTEQRGVAILTRAQSVSELTSFLPAPRTWLEWTNEIGGRTGVLLSQDSIEGWIRIRIAQSGNGSFGSGQQQYRLSLQDIRGFQASKDGPPPDEATRTELASMMLRVHGLLAMINTPRIIGRRQHMPHRGLERDLIARKKLIGKFPLHAWTEIKLEVSPPQDMSSRAPVEGHLTGERALHFCRAYLRVRLGRLEIVSSSWRGNPALGIKQARYRLALPVGEASP